MSRAGRSLTADACPGSAGSRSTASASRSPCSAAPACSALCKHNGRAKKCQRKC